MTWEYSQPVKIVFGPEKRKTVFELAGEMGLSGGAVLVCDPALERLGFAEELYDLADGSISDIFSRFGPNPETRDVDALAKAIGDAGAGYVIAMGGGSALDCAKAACVMAPAGGSVEAYHGTDRALPDTGLPLIALPSTAGTGSEVTGVSVLTNSSKGFKAPMVCKGFYPRAAIVDPCLTYSLPPKVAAQTGMDVLAHAVEGFVNQNSQPICDAMCIEAARIVFGCLEAACAEPVNRGAKNMLAQASVMAGLGFNLPKTGPAHACSFILTNRFGIPHGEACALTLDYFLRLWNGPKACTLAERLGFGDVFEMAESIAGLKRKLGLLTDLFDFGLAEKDIPFLVESSKHPNMNNSPIPITDEHLIKLYRGLILPQ